MKPLLHTLTITMALTLTSLKIEAVDLDTFKYADFPEIEQCGNASLHRTLEDLKIMYAEGRKHSRQWRQKNTFHEKKSSTVGNYVGDIISNRKVQVGTLATVAVVGTAGILYAVSFPASLVVIVVVGAAGAMYIAQGPSANWLEQLAHDKNFELQRIEHMGLVVQSQEYDKNYLWDEQILRFGGIKGLTNEALGLPSYSGSYKLLPMSDLPILLNQQFSYFDVRTKLLSETFRQLQISHSRNEWYVRFTTSAENERAKAKVAKALSDLYNYQSELAVATATAINGACQRTVRMPMK